MQGNKSPSGYIFLPDGQGTLLERLRLRGYHLRADCGGEGNCGKCRVKLKGSLPPPSEEDRRWLTVEEINSAWRLACRHQFEREVKLVHSPEWQLQFELHGVSDFPASDRVGLAVDLGTTGLVAALVDLDRGEPFLLARGFNPQRAWGADVMTRLTAARNQDTMTRLQAALLAGVNSAVTELFQEAGCGSLPRPDYTLGVGNTAMLHLASATPETTLSVSPFRSPLEGNRIISILLDGKILRLAGPLQSYIGSDLLAVAEYAAPHRQGEPTLLMDLGTNSEIALWDGQRYWVTSCAAGPAFEGGNISCGAPAGPRISTGVKLSGNQWLLLPRPGRKKAGLCGSALISLLAELMRAGQLRHDGKFVDGTYVELQAGSGSRPPLHLTQKDVRTLQLAKGAIHAGIKTLKRRAGLSYGEMRSVVVTGAFARDLKVDDLKEIGLFPACTEDVSFLNDGALRGAAKALASKQEPFQNIRTLMKVINLAEEADFQDLFMEGLALQPME